MDEQQKQEINTLFQIFERKGNYQVAKAIIKILKWYGKDAEDLLLEDLEDWEIPKGPLGFVETMHPQIIVEALGYIKSEKAVKPLVKLFKRIRNLQYSIVDALDLIGGAEVSHALTELLLYGSSDNSALFLNVLDTIEETLIKFRTDEAVQVLTQLFETTEEIEVKISVAIVLAAWNQNNALNYLLTVLKDPNTFGLLEERSIIQTVFRTVGKFAIPALIELLQSDEPAVIVRVLKVFDKWTIDDYLPEIVEPIINLLSSDNPEIRSTAVLLIGKLKDKQAVKPLIKVLAEEDPDVRRTAIFSLGQLKDAQALTSLQNFPRVNNDDATNLTLDWALSRFGISPQIPEQSAKVPEAALTSGWTLERKVDITEYLKWLREDKFSVTPIVYKLLENLVGLTFELLPDAAYPDNTIYLKFDLETLEYVLKQMEEKDIYEFAEYQINSVLCPIGGYDYGGYIYPVLVDSEGLFYKEQDGLFSLKGVCWQQLLNHSVNFDFGVKLPSFFGDFNDK